MIVITNVRYNTTIQGHMHGVTLQTKAEARIALQMYHTFTDINRQTLNTNSVVLMNIYFNFVQADLIHL